MKHWIQMQAIQTSWRRQAAGELFELHNSPRSTPTRRLARPRIHIPPLARPQRTASLSVVSLPRLNSVSCNQLVWRAGANTAPLLDVPSHCPTRTITTRKQQGFLNSPKHHARLEATREGIFSTPPSRRLKTGTRLTLHS